MPAASDAAGSEGPEDLPKTWRPLGPRIVAWILVVALAVVCAMTWIGFDEKTKASFTLFQKLTLAFVGLLVLGCVHALTRSRVTARREGLVVVNGYRKRTLEWAEIVAVNLPPGAPWVRLDLADGSEISAMGIQGSDGASAKRAVRRLRELVSALS